MKQVTIPTQWLQELIALCGPEDHELRERVMSSAAPAPADSLATGGQAQAAPDGWREQFAAEVYADLAAADNQDVPLEEYPSRILKVLDSIVGPRHPVVIKWRNDAIKNCIAIAYKYCRDPDSHKYLKQDLEALLTAEPAPQQADARDAVTFEQRMSDWQHGDALDAERYRWLRSRDLETISQGGVFAGMTPQNVILNEEDLDQAVDAAIAAAKGE